MEILTISNVQFLEMIVTLSAASVLSLRRIMRVSLALLRRVILRGYLLAWYQNCQIFSVFPILRSQKTYQQASEDQSEDTGPVGHWQKRT